LQRQQTAPVARHSAGEGRSGIEGDGPLPRPDLAYVVRRDERAAFGGLLDALADRAPFVDWDRAHRLLLELDVVRERLVTRREHAGGTGAGRHVPLPESPIEFGAEPRGLLHAGSIDGGGMRRG